MRIKLLNIFAATLLLLSSASMAAAGNDPVTHKVAKGETLYGISKQYGITVDQLIELNPDSRNGISPGSVLIISNPETTATEPSAIKPSTDGTHTIAQGETLYRIAQANNLTVEDLLIANPELDALNYSAGMVIVIPPHEVTETVAPSVEPVKSTVESAKPTAEPTAQSVTIPRIASEKKAEAEVAAQPESVEAEVAVAEFMPSAAKESASVAKKDKYLIGIMLPFMLREGDKSSNARRSTDFYKGFLLAVDSISKKTDTKFDIFAYDTCDELQTVKKTLGRSEIKHLDAIVGPMDQQQFDYVVTTVEPYDVYVFNMFIGRDEMYLDHKNVLQSTINSGDMFVRAIDAFVDQAQGRTPVFIINKNAEGSRIDFVNQLKSRLWADGIDFKEIEINGQLTAADLEQFAPAGSYLFIPDSPKPADFRLFASELKKFKSTLESPDNIAIFGYPEWLTYREDLYNDLNELNAMAFSRYFSDFNEYTTAKVTGKYNAMYGESLRDEYPSMALLGFDTGWYILSTLSNYGSDFRTVHPDYDGLQINFSFNDDETEGLANSSLVLVKFSNNSDPKCRKI